VNNRCGWPTVHKQLQAMLKLLKQANQKKAVVAAALAQCDFDVPDYLVMRQASLMLEEFSNQLASEGALIYTCR
jgi:FKBP-type peptidyl-prolyl cis-trans isomerase (trigger factor)